jgi:hypothetical protein
MRDAHPVGGPATSEPNPPRRLLVAVVLVALGLVASSAALALATPASGVVAATSSSVAPISVAPTTTRPAIADDAASSNVRPQRGAARQVTPTLPPPTTSTTTTTLPPIDVVPAKSGEGRRIVYSNSRQRVWAVDANGTLVKTHAVSGKRWVPDPGTYSVFSRSLYTNSLQNPDIKWMYMVRFTKAADGDNIGFHEIPTRCDSSGRCWKLQSESQLGQPLSGGCIRQSTADALWLWNWAPIGTKVVVVA